MPETPTLVPPAASPDGPDLHEAETSGLAGRILAHPLLWPLLALVVLLVVNVIATPSFLTIRMQDGHLFGSLIDIARNGAPVLLVALGMTLVIATRGIDLSVGAIAAIAGAVACVHIVGSRRPGCRLDRDRRLHHGTGRLRAARSVERVPRRRRSASSRSSPPWC